MEIFFDDFRFNVSFSCDVENDILLKKIDVPEDDVGKTTKLSISCSFKYV